MKATYEGQALTVKTSDAGVDGYVSYSNNTKVGYGTVTIRGMGDYYGTVSAQYKIVPPVVTGVSVTRILRPATSSILVIGCLLLCRL